VLLSEIVDTSRRVGATRGRREKIRLMADLLNRTPSGEIEIAVAFLSGSPRQGRLGVGPAQLRRAWPETGVETPGLELAVVDERLARIASTGGPGSTAERVRLLEDPWSGRRRPSASSWRGWSWASSARERWRVWWPRRSPGPRRPAVPTSGAHSP
jgi:hypothetical protein